MIAAEGIARNALIALALAVFCTQRLLAAPVATGLEPPELACSAAILIDPETRQVLYAHNPDERRAVASLTKMMTALLVAESGNLDRTVTVSKEAADAGQATMNLSEGEELSLRHILYGLLIASGNDASIAAAEAVSGSVEAFVDRMNERAAELGLAGTEFRNPHGLHDDGHHSTARDMAMLGLQVIGRAELRPIVRRQEEIVPWPGRSYDRTLRNSNRLLGEWEHCDGIKTGYTRSSGSCLAASAYVDGWRLVCVVLDSENVRNDARSLLEWGFNSFYKVALISRELTRANLVVNGGLSDTLDAYADEDVIAILPRTQRPEEPTVLVPSVDAPVFRGEVVGQLGVTLPDGSMSTVDLRASEDIPMSAWARVTRGTWSFAGMALLIACAVGVLVHGTVAEAVGSRRSR